MIPECPRLLLINLLPLVLFVQYGSPTGLGPCLQLESMPNFNMTGFTGHWYEVERSFYLMELISSCVSLDITVTDRGRLQIVINTKSTWSGSFSISEGIAVPSKKDPSQFMYKVADCPLPRILNRYLPGAGLYKVLKTDYEKYAIIYSCTDYQVIHSDLIWIWGRKKELNADTRAKIYSILEDFRLDSERLTLSKNNNCSDY